MGSNQELFMALQMLDKGIGQIATTKAIHDANSEVRSLNESMVDEAQKVEGLRNVANNLTRRLAGLGMDTAHIEQISNSIQAPKAPLIQSPFQGMLADLNMQTQGGRNEAAARSSKYINDQNTMKQALAFQKNETKRNDTFKKDYTAALKDFRDKAAKAELQGLDELSTAGQEIAGGNLGYVMGLKSLIKRTDPRISNEDFALAVPNKSLATKAHRAYSELIEGKPLTEDAEAVMAMVEVLKERTAKRATMKAQNYAKVRSKLVGVGADEFLNDLLSEHNLGGVVSPQAPAGQQPPAAAPKLPSAFKPRKKN